VLLSPSIRSSGLLSFLVAPHAGRPGLLRFPDSRIHRPVSTALRDPVSVSCSGGVHLLKYSCASNLWGVPLGSAPFAHAFIDEDTHTTLQVITGGCDMHLSTPHGLSFSWARHTMYSSIISFFRKIFQQKLHLAYLHEYIPSEVYKSHARQF